MIWDSFKQAIQLLFEDGEVWAIILRSLQISGLAVLIGCLVGIPLGIAIGMARFRGRGPLVSMINTGMAFPPVVVGLLVFMLLSRSGPLGSLQLLYTKQAMVVAQLVLAVPLIMGITISGIGGIPSEVLQQAKSLGASRWQTALVALSEARPILIVAVVAGFGRIVAEVGAVMIVGGNFHGDTQVMTTAIMEEVRKGDFSLALALGMILLLIAFAANGFMTRLEQKAMAA
jgi:tungstate transport system permease protein